MRYLVLIGCIINGAFSQVPTRIESVPSECQVLIDNKKIGETPLSQINLSSGNHTIILLKEKYAPVQYELTIQPAKSLLINFRLNKLQTITFTTKEEGLSFVLNEDHRWTEPKMKFEMEAGEHHLQVFSSDSLVDEQVILINSPITIFYQLTPDSLTGN